MSPIIFTFETFDCMPLFNRNRVLYLVDVFFLRIFASAYFKFTWKLKNILLEVLIFSRKHFDKIFTIVSTLTHKYRSFTCQFIQYTHVWSTYFSRILWVILIPKNKVRRISLHNHWEPKDWNCKLKIGFFKIGFWKLNILLVLPN